MPVGDITQGYIFVPAEKNIDQTKLNAIAGQAYINPAFISGQTPASSTGTGDYFVFLQSGGTLAKILTQDLASSIGSSSGMTSAITAVRLRSFNAIGDCNFEVDQRTAGIGITAVAAGFAQDRWLAWKTGSATLVATGKQNAANVLIPGTNFAITSKFLRATITTAQASLGAGDALYIRQYIEGPMCRELASDVSSISILCRSSVAGLSFGIALNDSASAYSLTNLCTLSTANTWSLLTLPNIPVFTASGTFPMTPGNVGYILNIGLASGTTLTAPSNGTWVAGNFIAAQGQSNFAANLNATFDIAFIQHEPGPVCTQLMDVPFSGPNGSFEACQRYYQKSYNYGAPVGAVTTGGVLSFYQVTVTQLQGSAKFSKTMAKGPTVTIYNWNTGAANALYHNNGTVYAVSSVNNIGDSGFNAMTVATMPAVVAGAAGQFHYTADTGW